MLAQLADVTFAYSGGDPLFEGLTWQVNAGARIGLVGPNGAGKSTLLRLLAGTLTPETGQVARQRGVTMGYLHQSQEFHGEGDGTILSALLAPFAKLLRLRAELEAATAKLEEHHGDAALLEEYGHLEETYRRGGGYTLEARVRELAMDVGFGEEDLPRHVDTLSGGERNRLELAKVLLAAPDLLLLDEPTNHLDMDACERLEGFLRSYPGAFVLVSHDRYFLDAVCSEIVEIDDGRIERYAGGWSKYVEEREKRRELALAAFQRQRAEIERTEDFIRKNIAGQGTNQAKSRRKMLDKIERLEWHRDVWQAAGRIGLRFEVGDRPGGKDVLTAEQLAVGYPAADPSARPVALVRGIDLTIYRGDRVGIVGPNGAGKSTLLKTLLGKLPPADGTCRRGHELKVAYFDQKLGELDDARSLIDEIRTVRGDWAEDTVRTYLARFRFFGDEAFRVVKGLSGGERNRLSLAKMMLRPANVLALDEPTNHLDIPAREVLERALRAYEGTLLVVSHDRFFLDQICTRLIIIDHGRVEVETGNYSDWRRRLAQRNRANAEAAARRAETDAKAAARAKAGADKAKAGAEKRGAADFEREKQKKAERAKLEKRFAALEAEIATLEQQIAAARAQLATAHGGDWQKLNALVEDERKLAERLKSRLGEWEKLGSQLEA